MRISDWSSDVCSSDLAQNIANADTPGYRSHDLAEPDFAKILGRTAGRHDRTVTQPAVTITPRMTALGSRAAATATRTADVNGSDEKPDGNNVVLEAELLRLSGLQTDYATARSAEHTSELQSLMRNTYAVFCL